MFHSIVKDDPRVKAEIKVQAAESLEPVAEGAPWYAVLASLPASDLAAARTNANEKLAEARRLGFSQGVQIYRTKISNNYAVVIGGQMPRPDAFALSSGARQKGLASDAFPQQDRMWSFVGEAPFK
jgi:hypothetical protein